MNGLFKSQYQGGGSLPRQPRYGRWRKKVTVTAVVGALSTSLLAACSGGGGSSANVLTVQVQTDAGPQFANFIKIFKEQNPGVTVQTLSVSQTAKTGSNLAALTSSDAPDVAIVPTNTQVFSRLTEAKGLVSLSSIWKADNLDNNSPPGVLAADSLGGTPYVVSYDTSLYNILYYNVDLFKKLHIAAPADHRIPSMAALDSMVSTLRAHGYQGIGIGPADQYQSSWMIDSFMNTSTTPAQYTNYLSSWQKSTPVTYPYTSAPFTKALDAIQSLGQANVFANGYLADTVAQAEAQFVQQRVGMLLDGQWSVATLKGDGLKFPIDWMLLPPVPGSQEKNRISLYTGDALGIPVRAPNQALAKKFLQVVMSVKGQESNLATGHIPAITSGVPASQYAMLGPVVQSEIADTKLNGDQIGWTSGVPGGLGQQFTDPKVQAMLNHQTTPAQIGPQVQDQLATFRGGGS